jgi:Icc-related predicted phosphoesterase
MKFLLHSDTHSFEDKVKLPKNWKPDIVLGAGDITTRGQIFQIEHYIKWLSEIDFNLCCVFIAGNHDLSFDPTRSLSWEYNIVKDILYTLDRNDRIHYLQNSDITINDIKIWGSPVSPWFFGNHWAFNKHRGREIMEVWNTIPDDIEILITHGPVKGMVDTVEEGDSVGCEMLAERIKSLPNLKMVISGHIHEAHGHHTDERGILYVNASVLNRRYEVVNKPILVEKIDNKYIVIDNIND